MINIQLSLNWSVQVNVFTLVLVFCILINWKGALLVEVSMCVLWKMPSHGLLIIYLICHYDAQKGDSISNRKLCCFSYIIAMVHQNSQTVEFWQAKIEGNLRRANTEPSVDFRRTNTEQSVDFRKANTGLIQVKEEGRTGCSDGWQGCFEGFPEGEARGKSRGAVLPARGKPRPSWLFYLDLHSI